MDFKGQSAITGVAISMLIFLIIMVVTQNVVNASNLNVFSDGVADMLNLLPVVLFGAAIISVIVVAFRLSA
jgi:TRAP-type mannitol/chloroaromatic compound transport system permease small subunit